MDVSLYSAASAMNATERWQDLIASNLATSSIPGARQRNINFSSVVAGQAATGDSLVVPQTRSSVNFQQGELRATGNNMDYAIEGPGFFTVQLPDGSPAYTRDGEFRLNAQNQLVNKQGYALMSDTGVLQFDPNNDAPISIAADGLVSQGDEVKGKLSVVEFADRRPLVMLGGGLFRNEDPNVLPKPGANSFVRQGFIEQANTSPTLAMASMITAMRMFETNHRVMAMQNERMGKAIADLGGTS